MPADTILKRLFDRAASHPTAPAYCAKRGGVWVPTGYGAYADHVRRAGKALIARGCQPGGTVSILGYNRPEWVVFDLACMAIGGAPAGIYTTSSPSEARYIIHHAESPVVLVENAAQWEKVRKERANLPHLRWVVTMEGTTIDDPMVLTWEQFLSKGSAVPDADFFARMHALEPGNMATLIYTSGTTGPPKGVMLSHENLAWTATTAAREAGSIHPGDCNLSYLPLSHIAEQIVTIHGPITAGSTVYYAESLDKVPANLREVRPTIFFGVPRIWEKFHAGITAKLGEATGTKKRIAHWALRVGSRVNDLRMRSARVPRRLALQHRLADRLVFSKMKAALGLDRARICVTGAAPLAKEVIEFFGSIDVMLLEGYGLSETAGTGTLNHPGAVRIGTVGTCARGFELKIAGDGEILVRGRNVFLGYYKDPTATAEALADGFLHTGDLGSLDAKGFVSITGRKKEIIITAGGKNVAPTNIEAALKNHPLVSEAIVIGDRRKYLTVLITLDGEAAVRFRGERALNDDAAHPDHPAILAEVQRALDAVNGDLAHVEQVKKFRILNAPFSIETGELTPTLKLKRSVVASKFADEIESMYGG